MSTPFVLSHLTVTSTLMKLVADPEFVATILIDSW
jgi:hypothetical protein